MLPNNCSTSAPTADARAGQHRKAAARATILPWASVTSSSASARSARRSSRSGGASGRGQRRRWCWPTIADGCRWLLWWRWARGGVSLPGRDPVARMGRLTNISTFDSRRMPSRSCRAFVPPTDPADGRHPLQWLGAARVDGVQAAQIGATHHALPRRGGRRRRGRRRGASMPIVYQHTPRREYWSAKLVLADANMLPQQFDPLHVLKSRYALALALLRDHALSSAYRIKQGLTDCMRGRRATRPGLSRRWLACSPRYTRRATPAATISTPRTSRRSSSRMRRPLITRCMGCTRIHIYIPVVR